MSGHSRDTNLLAGGDVSYCFLSAPHTVWWVWLGDGAYSRCLQNACWINHLLGSSGISWTCGLCLPQDSTNNSNINYHYWTLTVFSSVQLSHVRLFVTPWTEHARPPHPSPTPRVHWNPCPLSQWCHPAISSSVVPFSSCPQSLPASGSFQMSQLFISGGQNIGVSASTSVLPMNTQDWSPLGWTAWISLQSKILSRVFSSATVQKHQFFGIRPSIA